MGFYLEMAIVFLGVIQSYRLGYRRGLSAGLALRVVEFVKMSERKSEDEK